MKQKWTWDMIRQHFQPKHLNAEIIIFFTVTVSSVILLFGVIACLLIGKYVGEQNTNSTYSALDQIDRNFNSELHYAENISLFTISNKNVREYLTINPAEQQRINALFDSINTDFSNFGNTNSDIISIGIYGKNGLDFETAGSSFTKDRKYEEAARSLPQSGFYIVTPMYERFYSLLSRRYVISLMRKINNPDNFSQQIGMLRIDLDEANLESIYKQVRLGETGYFLVTDSAGNLVSASDKRKLSENLRAMPAFAPAYRGVNGVYRRHVASQDMMIFYSTSSSGLFKYFGVVPYREMTREMRVIICFIALIAFVIILLSVFVAYLMSRQIAKPIRLLSSLAKQVENGNLDVISNIRRKDELGELSSSLNTLAAKMRTLIEKQFADRLEREKLKLRMLQSQINPHFLYNTLDVLYWTARVEGASKTSDIANALAQFYKLGLNRGNEVTTVNNEVRHLESYIAIQRMRYDYELNISVDIDPLLNDRRILHLILQPVVENALQHGIAPIGKEGRVTVTGRADGENIVFTVEDNGVGMSPDEVEALFRGPAVGGHGFGLKNADARIRLYCGPQYGISVASRAGVGTRVEIRLPQSLPETQTDGGPA